MIEFDGSDFIEEIEALSEEYKYFEDAQRDIEELYENDRRRVYYIRQLQVKFEKKYFHWITYHVLRYLNDLEKLEVIERKQKDGTTRHFYIHQSNRYPVRKINEMEKIINEFSQDHITRSCGRRAEDLFCLGLTKKGFRVRAEKVREFNGKKWERTGHDLDYVFERDGINYGCEIKNTLSYIEKNELETKIKMCEFFKVRPLFIMRFAPKSYINEINKKGGFALIFKYQLYELSQINLVKKIKEVLEMPVGCPGAIEEGTIKRFENWHIKQKDVNSKKIHKKKILITLKSRT